MHIANTTRRKIGRGGGWRSGRLMGCSCLPDVCMIKEQHAETNEYTEIPNGALKTRIYFNPIMSRPYRCTIDCSVLFCFVLSAVMEKEKKENF